MLLLQRGKYPTVLSPQTRRCCNWGFRYNTKKARCSMFSNFSYSVQLLLLEDSTLREEAGPVCPEGIPRGRVSAPGNHRSSHLEPLRQWVNVSGLGEWGGERRERRMEEQRKTGIEGQVDREEQNMSTGICLSCLYLSLAPSLRGGRRAHSWKRQERTQHPPDLPGNRK